MIKQLEELLDEIYQDHNTLGDYPLDKAQAYQSIKHLIDQACREARIKELIELQKKYGHWHENHDYDTFLGDQIIDRIKALKEGKDEQ